MRWRSSTAGCKAGCASAGRENREKLQAELEHAKEEYEENSLLLKQSIQGSRSPAVAELAQVQWEYMHKVEDLLKEKAEPFFHCEATSKEEDQAEAASLFAEYAHGFRHASHAVCADCGPSPPWTCNGTRKKRRRNKPHEGNKEMGRRPAGGCSRCRRRGRWAGLLEPEETQTPSPRERQRSRKPCPWKSRGRKPPTGRPLVRRRPQRRQSLR